MLAVDTPEFKNNSLNLNCSQFNSSHILRSEATSRGRLNGNNHSFAYTFQARGTDKHSNCKK